MDPVLQQLLDEREIAAVCVRYATAIDDRDWDRLRSCFVPDAVGLYHADRPLSGRPAIEEAIRTAVTPLTRTQHLVTNIAAVVQGDEASCSCYLLAQHVRDGVPGGEQFVIAGQYRDRFVRTDGGWRIRERPRPLVDPRQPRRHRPLTRQLGSRHRKRRRGGYLVV